MPYSAAVSDDVAIEGILQRYVFRNPESGFAIVRIVPDDAAEVTAKGVLSGVEEGERVRIQGKWEEDPRFGRQVRIQSFLPVTPTTARGIEDFLRGGRTEGIGKVFAKRLVEHFGEQVLEVLESQPHRLTEVEGIGPGRAKAILTAWRERQSDRESLIFLQGLGLTPSLANKVAHRYGQRTVEVVRENPYRLAAEVGGIGFLTADSIARELGIAPDSPYRIRAGLLFALSRATGEGHCYLPGPDLEERATKLLKLPWERVRPCIGDLLGEGTVQAEERHGESRLWLTERLDAEELVAWRLARLLEAGDEPLLRDPAAGVDKAEERVGLRLSDDQRAAVEASLRHRVLVLTGGPGTGKTTIVRAVLSIWEQLGLRVKLAAPTGRAARRLEESSGRMASTLHRLLEYSPREHRFLRDLENPLVCDALVIDEASMVDIDLMAAVMAGAPEGVRLLLVGDVDQLPSVGPGRVLADLIDSGALPVARLTAVHRQDEQGLIVANAHRALRGVLPEASRSADGDFFVIARDDPEEVVRTVAHLVVQRIPAAWGLDPLADVQVLVPMRKGPCGTEALNQALRRGMRERRSARDGSPVIEDTGRRPRLFDRVMQTKNNYDKDTFNGDVGVVIATADKSLRVRFDSDREVDYTGEERDQLELAYATTIHKSQGSEYPAVVIPLVTQHFRMLRRNLVYTAMTRGKQVVVIVGSRRALEIAVSTEDASVRYTGLAGRLREAVGR